MYLKNIIFQSMSTAKVTERKFDAPVLFYRVWSRYSHIKIKSRYSRIPGFQLRLVYRYLVDCN
jgi:hypothetical protein